jgi:hypothetical protein
VTKRERLEVTKKVSFGATKKWARGDSARAYTKTLVIAQNISPYYNKAWGVKMNLVELVKGTSSEKEANDRCPFCGHQKIDRCREE